MRRDTSLIHRGQRDNTDDLIGLGSNLEYLPVPHRKHHTGLAAKIRSAFYIMTPTVTSK